MLVKIGVAFLGALLIIEALSRIAIHTDERVASVLIVLAIATLLSAFVRKILLSHKQKQPG